MSTVKRSISLLLVWAILCSILPVGATAMNADHSHSNHSLQETVVAPQALDLSGLSCDSFISNKDHRDYINMMLRYYINSDSKLQNALSKGLSVVFFFEGGSDNYPGSTYENNQNDIRDQAVVIVVKNDSNGNAAVVTYNEICSTIPSDPVDAIQIDGTYPIYTWNHKQQYGALQIDQKGKAACLYTDKSKDGELRVGSGINIHTRKSSVAGGWSAGCLLVGKGNNSSNYFNTFMRIVAGLNCDVWIDYHNGQFTTIISERDMGYCVIDRQLAKSGMSALYNDVALNRITKASDDAREDAEQGPSPEDYIELCEQYPSYRTVQTIEASTLWNIPCTQEVTPSAKEVKNTKAGDTLTVTAMYKNTVGEYWYKVSYDGTTGYIFGGDTDDIEDLTNDITFTDAVIPSQITVGNSFSIGGVIKSEYNVIKYVTAYVTSADGAGMHMESGDDVNGRYYSLKSSKVDNNLKFATLGVGSYYYTISVWIENYLTTDGSDLGCDYIPYYVCDELFYVLEKGGHICNFDSYVYDDAEHPHYKCYKCSICGKVSKNTSEPTQSNTCDQCRPGKGVLNVSVSSDQKATFTWADTANTTHYVVLLAMKNADGNWETIETVSSAESGFEKTFNMGEYRAQLLSYNSQMREPDDSDWVHTQADDIYFSISCEHDYTSEHIDATCVDYGYTIFTCNKCSDTYIRSDAEYSEWSPTKPVDVDESMIDTKKQYRYSDYEKITSYDPDLPGWDRLGNEWEKSGSGTITYVRSWPVGFLTSHKLYNEYNKMAKCDSETETDKTEISSDNVVGYLYYHWCRGDTHSYPDNRKAKDTQQDDCNTFHAFYRETDPSTLETPKNPDGSYKLPNKDCCSSSHWYYYTPVYSQTYTDYRNLFTYGCWSDWSEWSDTVYNEGGDRKVDERTMYRIINGVLADHSWNEGEVTIEATCLEPGEAVYTCTICSENRVETIPALGHDWLGASCSRCGNRKNPFVDVAVGSFYYDPVMWAVDNGITNGTSENTFGPNDQCMRAHVVTFLWRAMGSPEPTKTDNPFVDVKPADFYYKPVLWALENGITSGMDATHFGPTSYCNRAQVVTFLYRTMGNPEISNTANPFTDVAAGSFYERAVLWAVENGITNGLSATSFGPNSICNRAQIVTFLYRAFN